jgi:hypothetical protein
MKSKAISQVILAVFVACIAAVFASAQEAKIREQDVPSAVISAFKTAYPNAKVRGYAKEKENGKVFYEIESTDGTTKRDLLYNPDGTVAEIEETIVATDLPSAAQEFIHSKYPRAVVSRAERVTEGDKVEYEVSARQAKRRISLAFDVAGKVIKNTVR